MHGSGRKRFVSRLEAKEIVMNKPNPYALSPTTLYVSQVGAFESYGFKIVIGRVTDVALSVTVKLTIVPFVPAHAIAAVTVNWPLVVRVSVEIVTRLPAEDAATL